MQEDSQLLDFTSEGLGESLVSSPGKGLRITRINSNTLNANPSTLETKSRNENNLVAQTTQNDYKSQNTDGIQSMYERI